MTQIELKTVAAGLTMANGEHSLVLTADNELAVSLKVPPLMAYKLLSLLSLPVTAISKAEHDKITSDARSRDGGSDEAGYAPA